MAQPNSTNPRVVFGLASTQHRELRVMEFLKYYNRPFRRTATRAQLLNHLAPLQEYFSDAQTLIIADWFRGGGLLSDLRPILIKAKVQVRDLARISEPPPLEAPNSELQTTPLDRIVPLVREQECRVCLVTLMGDAFPRNRITTGCRHGSFTCLDCVRQSLDIQAQDKPWDHISCPECPAIVSYHQMKKFASPAQFKLYDQKRHIAALHRLPNFLMCSSSTCNSGQIHPDGAKNPIMRCTACAFLTCFTHKVPWHKGTACENYDMFHKSQQEQEVESEGYLKKHAKVCPNGVCGLHVQKVDGCDHIYCTHCHFEFCWTCLASYNDIRREGNTGHKPDCKHHTDQLNTIRHIPAARPMSRQYRPQRNARRFVV